VLKKSDAIPSLVTSGLDTVGLRVPNHPIAQQLLQLADRPIAAPSANHFGSTSPTRANHVKVDCDLLLDGGPCTTGIESTVIAIGNDNQITLLRPGGTTAEAIESLTGQPLRQRDPSNRQATKAPASPGMIDRHYATDTPLQLLDADEPIPVPPDSASWGLMTFNAAGVNERYKQIKHLGPDGDLTAAAAQLFEAMHNLDRCGLDRIIAQPAPMLGLGIAINDRLRRASQKAEPDPTS
jgi:L-threonylcarbamoyladenylate synthase